MASDTIPWEDLSDREKENFRSLLHDRGIKVTIEEAAEYYGNKAKVEREATEPDDGPEKRCPDCYGEMTQEGLLLDGDPGFCPHCGADLVEGDGDASSLIREVTVPLTPGQMDGVETGARLTDATVEEFCRDAIRGRIQALENVLAEKRGGT